MPADLADTADVQARFAAALAVPDVPAGVRVILDAYDAGLTVDRLIVDVLAPAQREVGRRWETGEWSVADEHAATLVTDAAVTALDLHARPTQPPKDGPRVVISCVENEWHVLPAKLVALFAAHCGAHVVLLGATMPAAALRHYLASADVDVVALSCTMPTNLLSARRTVAAAQDVGVPVIVGGRAFGEDAARAAAIGADAFTADVRALIPTARAATAGTGSASEVPPDALAADAIDDAVLARVVAELSHQHPAVRDMNAFALDATMDDLRWVARFTAAALGCGDPRILDDMLGWLLRVLDHRRVPREPVVDGFRLLATALEDRAPAAAGLLRERLEHLAV